MVERLVSSVLDLPSVSQVIVVLNIRESMNLPSSERITVIENDSPRGFGANHNLAFKHSRQPFFCPMNPDITIQDDPFPGLLSAMDIQGVGVAAPVVVNTMGEVEDSARYFPTIRSVVKKILFGSKGIFLEVNNAPCVFPEWVAGMFMLFRRESFMRLNGFDEGFYLYYEDVDICVRLWRQGERVVLWQGARVIHDARRDSHRNVAYLKFHMASMLRYFAKYWGRLPKIE